MLTHVWSPAASSGITRTGVDASETDRFDMFSLPSFARVRDRMVLFPAAPTVRFTDSIWRMPQV